MIREIKEIKLTKDTKIFSRKHKGLFIGTISFIIVTLIIIVFLPTGDKNLTRSNKIIGIKLGNEKLTLSEETAAYINLNTHQNAVNVVGITMQVDPAIIEIVSVDTSSSFCTLYARRNFDAAKGTVHLECGKPTPGFTGQNLLETIHLKAIGYGKTDFYVTTNSKVLKNNGHPTNILTDFDKTTVSVILSQ